MKRNLVTFLLALVFGMLASTTCWAGVKKQKLRVLYLGGQADWTHGEMGSNDHFKSEAEFQAEVAKREASFGDLLRTYFTTVKTMQAKDWKPEMSNGYDVTIFDGCPPVLKETEKEYIFKGVSRTMKEKEYLPQDYSCPTITIASMGERIGQKYGTKNDWLCLCLDADAHSMNLQHPIFKGPFKTKITLTKQPTPEDAFHYAYYQDGNVPDSVMMWKVNTEGYKTNPDFNIGMVSRPWGYLDSPDCEFISSGVCAKTLDAVALGRHGNFLTWGFIGSPMYMTPEAKVVFANAVAYIAKFRGTPLVRKYNENIATREILKEDKYICTKKYVQERAVMDKVFYEETLKIAKQAREKKAKGEELSGMEKMYVDFTEADVPTEKTYAETMKEKYPILYAKFGEDETKYQQYYDDNKPYFYGGEGSYTFVIDDDAKAWGIPNNDKRLIDKAITCLENNQEVERAKRVLRRYTLCEFTNVADWRKWYNTYKDKMFFTESGGWYFMVNDRKAPGNDYSVAKKRLAEQEAAEKASSSNAKASHENPVVVTARVQKLDIGGMDIVFDVKIMPGYHIYRTVAESDPYIPMKITCTLPDGAVLGEAYYPMPKPFVKEGTTIYDSNVTIRQNVSLPSLQATIKCTFECQCCDANVCMPPFSKEFTLNVE